MSRLSLEKNIVCLTNDGPIVMQKETSRSNESIDIDSHSDTEEHENYGAFEESRCI